MFARNTAVKLNHSLCCHGRSVQLKSVDVCFPPAVTKYFAWKQNIQNISISSAVRPKKRLSMSALHDKLLKFNRKKLLSGLSFSIGLFRKKQTINEDALALIPKEVFKKEKPEAEKRYGFLMSLLQSLWKWVTYWLRVCQVCLVFSPLLSLYPVMSLNSSLRYSWYRMMLFTMEHMGPTFIKLGQWASTRRDLFSPEFCDIFCRLHNATKTHSWSSTEGKLTKAFGKNWRKVLVKVQRRPVGSGCIAQVHKAYIHINLIPDESIIDEVMSCEDDYIEDIDYGEGPQIFGFSQSAYDTLDSSSDEETSQENDAEDDLVAVAVKVLHPGITRLVTRDLDILQGTLKFAEYLAPSLRWLSLHECMQEFADLLTQQIDLRFEAECLEQFVENFENVPNVRFPRPIRPFCKRSVLVETFEEGVPISDFLRGDEEQPTGLKEKLASIDISWM